MNSEDKSNESYLRSIGRMSKKDFEEIRKIVLGAAKSAARLRDRIIVEAIQSECECPNEKRDKDVK